MAGIPLVVARSGWSKQGGYELYLMDGSKGTALWDLVREAGAPWNIGPGYPNPTERIESGLLSWGGDTDDTTNPFEVGLDRFVDLDVPDDVIGIKALRRLHEAGPERHLLGVILDGEVPMDPHPTWHPITVDGERFGAMTNGVWSRRLERNIGFALVNRAIQVGDRVHIDKGTAFVGADVVDLPFVRPRQASQPHRDQSCINHRGSDCRFRLPGGISLSGQPSPDHPPKPSCSRAVQF